MFVCLECGEVFENVAIWHEDRGEYFGFPSYEECCGSPCCHGDYVETHKCDECEEWICGKYIKTDSGKRVCEDCYCSYELGEEDY